MNAFPKAKSAGFTLVEVMVTIVVLSVLVGMALPSFLQMLRNSEISAAAESVASGLQRARAEAVSRNVRVQFVLGTGTSWRVDYVPATNPPIDSRPSTDSPNATPTVAPSLATTVTFNQLGQVMSSNPDPSNTNTSLPITQIEFNATGGYRILRVAIGVGGNARVCDPSLPSTNIRAC